MRKENCRQLGKRERVKELLRGGYSEIKLKTRTEGGFQRGDVG